MVFWGWGRSVHPHPQGLLLHQPPPNSLDISSRLGLAIFKYKRTFCHLPGCPVALKFLLNWVLKLRLEAICKLNGVFYFKVSNIIAFK